MKKEFNNPTIRVVMLTQTDMIATSDPNGVTMQIEEKGSHNKSGGVLAPGRANSILSGVADQK